MVKTFSLLACMLLLSVMLAACAGGDDDDPTATAVSSTPTTESAAAEDEEEEDASPTADDEPTATEETAEPTVEPTEEADATATEEPTEEVSTPEVSGTMPPAATEDTAGPTGTAEYEADPEVEAALLDMLLTEEEVPEEFELVSAGPVGPTDEGLTFCNEESFSRPEARLGGVEAEFDADPQMGPFLLESLTVYEEDVAAEAFEYARDITTSCEEWTDEDGITYQLEELEVPDYGDDSHALRMTFEVPGAGVAVAEFTLARFGGVLMAMGFISLEGTDTTQFQEITETAIEKVEAADPLP